MMGDGRFLVSHSRFLIKTMANHSKYNLVYRLQKWMDTVDGQTFLNYAYSWGASVVILGALFKLTHLPGANVMLFIGMGTEVFVFFISAFDRPFDKTADGREMPTHLTREYLETGVVTYGDGDESAPAVGEAVAALDGGAAAPAGETAGGVAQPVAGVQPVGPGGTIIINGGGIAAGAGGAVPESGGQAVAAATEGAAAAASVTGGGASVTGGGASAVGGASVIAGPQPNYVPQMSQEEAEKLNEAQGSYVDELQKLVETLGKVNEQSMRLTRDSEEMENLNRTLTGITRIYEMQLKGASQQVGTIDQINEQTRKMAAQIEQLNRIYARMIEAMTVNMRAAAPTAPTAPVTDGQP